MIDEQIIAQAMNETLDRLRHDSRPLPTLLMLARALAELSELRLVIDCADAKFKLKVGQ